MVSDTFPMKTKDATLMCRWVYDGGKLILTLISRGTPIKSKELPEATAKRLVAEFQKAKPSRMVGMVWALFGADVLKHTNGKPLASAMCHPGFARV